MLPASGLFKCMVLLDLLGRRVRVMLDADSVVAA
jgi:hypothetical protein